jgi:hypothetical protein
VIATPLPRPGVPQTDVIGLGISNRRGSPVPAHGNPAIELSASPPVEMPLGSRSASVAQSRAEVTYRWDTCHSKEGRNLGFRVVARTPKMGAARTSTNAVDGPGKRAEHYNEVLTTQLLR